MASGPITSWQIDGETVQTVSGFILGGYKIIEYCGCSYEIKTLAPWLKSYEKLDTLLKSRDIQFSSVQINRSVMSNCLQTHESQHARPPCPSPTPGVHSNSCPSSQWCHPAISFSIIPFSSCPQSLPASASFPMSQLFAWGGQSIGVSALASVLPMKTQDWPLFSFHGCNHNLQWFWSPPKIKSDTVSPSISHEVMGLDAMIFIFWMLSFILKCSLL